MRLYVEESESTSDERLKQSLLAKDETGEIDGILRVNFDPMLVRLLREVKYFLLLGVEAGSPPYPLVSHKVLLLLLLLLLLLPLLIST